MCFCYDVDIGKGSLFYGIVELSIFLYGIWGRY